MPRPRSLTDAQIADAALAVVERGGADALTMSALARELGVATMSLYRYVDGREHVETLMLDRILATLDCEPPQDEPWTSQALTLLVRLHDAIVKHPGAVPLVLARRSSATQSLRWGEALLSVLATAGLTGEPLVIAFRSLLSYVVGAIQVDQLGSLAGPGTAEIATLDAAAFPHLVAAARQARTITSTAEFTRGAESLIAGLARNNQLDRKARSRRR